MNRVLLSTIFFLIGIISFQQISAAEGDNEVTVIKGVRCVAVKPFVPHTNDTAQSVNFTVNAAGGKFVTGKSRVLISKRHPTGAMWTESENKESKYVAKSPVLQSNETSYVVCAGKWKQETGDITYESDGKTIKSQTLLSQRAELLNEGTRLFIGHLYSYETASSRRATISSITKYANKFNDNSNNFIVKCGVNGDISNINELTEYLNNKGLDLDQGEGIVLVATLGHGEDHVWETLDKDGNISEPIANYLDSAGSGLVGSYPSNDDYNIYHLQTGTVQALSMTESSFTNTFSPFLADREAHVSLFHCYTATRYTIAVGDLGLATFATRIKNTLTERHAEVYGIDGLVYSAKNAIPSPSNGSDYGY